MISSSLATFLRFLLLALLCSATFANPEDWISMAPDCFAHPTSREKRHSAPVADSLAAYNMIDKGSGNAVNTVCPGGTYSVTVNFPETSYALITVDNSVILNRQDRSKCFNRDLTSERFSEVTKWTRDFTVDCAASKDISVKVTRAIGERDGFLFSSMTSAVDSSCATAACAANAPSQPARPVVLDPPMPHPSSPSPPDVQVSTPGCDASAMGYQCSKLFGDVRVHWSMNVSAPQNDCTNTGTGSASLDPNAGVIHMAVSSETTGYVGFSFNKDASRMYPAEAVLGFITADGTATVDSWYMTEYYTISGTENALNPSWAKGMGVSQSSGVTTICFSRAMKDDNSIMYPVLPQFEDVQMAWAVGENGQVNYQTHKRQGGVVMNFGSGESLTQGVSNREKAINIHGILMSVAWILLLPLGALAPRHRWVFMDVKFMDVHVWFRVHQFCQLSGMALFIAGFVYAFYEFPDTPMGGDAGQAHKILGIIVMAMAGLQCVAACFRPSPASPTRKYWNFMHFNLGRLSMIVSWVTIYLGVYIYHENSIYQASYISWMVPIVVVNGTIVLLDLALTFYKWFTAPDSSSTDSDEEEGKARKKELSDFKQDLELQQMEISGAVDTCHQPGTDTLTRQRSSATRMSIEQITRARSSANRISTEEIHRQRHSASGLDSKI